jgi:membrane dipeptidase
VIGVALYGEFVHPESPTADRMVDHVDYLRRLVGIEHIAFGPDYIDYMQPRGPAATGQLAGVYRAERRSVEGMETAAQAHAFTAALLRRGYDESECAAILGGNYLRVCRAVLG